MPSGWAGTLEVCPVGQPRAYGDGFGAPRYAGGYHLHAGVDILAPYGTPIYATFDGYATSERRTGSAAWRSSCAARPATRTTRTCRRTRSTRPARSRPGTSSGTSAAPATPARIDHNHFEFHPNSFPSGWPTSYYGYTVIGSALNPYPLLVDACG